MRTFRNAARFHSDDERTFPALKCLRTRLQHGCTCRLFVRCSDAGVEIRNRTERLTTIDGYPARLCLMRYLAGESQKRIVLEPLENAQRIDDAEENRATGAGT